VNSLKQNLSLIIGFASSVFLLWFALRGVSLAEVGYAMSHAKIWLLIPLLSAYYLQLRIKASRWSFLIAPVTTVKGGQIFPAVMVGAMGSLIFPAYLSELARTYILCRQLDLKYTSVLITIVLERMFDFLTVLAFLGFLLVFERNLPPQFVTIGYLIGSIEIVLLLAVSAFVAWPVRFQRWIMILTSKLSSGLRSTILAQLEFATTGLQSIKQPRLLLTILILSLLQWLVMGVCTYIAILAFDIHAPFMAALMVLVLTVAGMTLPSAPGFFGTIQICFTLGLQPYGVPTDVAFATSIFFHLAVYLGTILPGIFYLRHIGYTLGRLRREAASIKGINPVVPQISLPSTKG